MNIELLDVIYGAIIVQLHATAEWCDSFSLVLSLLRPHGEYTQSTEGTTKAGRGTRRKWRVDGTVSHHLRFS